MDESLLKFGQQAHAPCGGRDELELVGRVDSGALCERNIEAAQHGRSRYLEQADGGPCQRHEDQHRRCDSDGQGLRTAQGERLGHQFAYDDMEVGDESKAECDGCDLGVEVCVRQAAKPAHKDGGGKGFAKPAESQRAKGDAKLDGGEKFVEAVLQAADGPGSGDTGGEHLLNPGLANGYQRELGSHKKGVGQDEHGHGDKFEQRKPLHLGVSIALRRSGIRRQLACIQ